MENNYQVKGRSGAIKEFIKSWKFWKLFLGIVIGGLAGFLYYYFVGCNSGSCASNTYMSMLWDGLLGLFLVNNPCSRGRC